MQKIRIFTLANDKHSSTAEQIAEFNKRIQRWAKVVESSLYSNRYSDLSQGERIEAEGNALLKVLKPGDYLIMLDLNGSQISSTEFSAKIQDLANRGRSNLCFAIGGNFGWSKSALDRADERISLSRLTFTSELSKLLLYEQLYRAYCIINRTSYHH